MTRQEGYSPLLKSYPDSEKINLLSIGAETLYTRLIAATDDAGRYFGDAVIVAAKLFTFRLARGQVDAATVEKWIVELESVGLAVRFRNGSVTYLELVGVFKRLRKDVKPQLRFPERVAENVTDPERTRDESGTERFENGPLDLDLDLDPKEIQSKPRAGAPRFAAPAEMVPIPASLDGEEFRAAWALWLDHLRQRSASPSHHTMMRQLHDLAGWGAQRAIAAINFCVGNGWVSLREESPDKPKARGLKPI